MRTLKILSSVVIAAIVAVFTYANVRSISPTERLKQIQLVSFNIAGEVTPDECVSLEKRVSALKGVTACSVNSSGTIASVTYYPDDISKESLASILSNNNQLQVAQKQFATSGGCPVHGVSASLSQFVSALDLRN